MGLIFSAKCTSNNRLDGKTAIITGANTGIGKITAKDFYERGATVILACRNMERAREAVADIKNQCESQQSLGTLKIVELDLSSLASVRRCAAKILATEKYIHLLINNAGLMMCPQWKTEDGFDMQFGTNYLGHFFLTMLLLPKICCSKPARIVNVSSVAHSFAGAIDFSDIHFDKRPYNRTLAYQQSKLAIILFTTELARKLKENNIQGVNVYSLHPGVIRTDLSRHFSSIVPGLSWIYDHLLGVWFKTPLQGAQTQIYCAVSDECANETGLYYAECAVAQCSRYARDAESANKLWDMSMRFVGLNQNELISSLSEVKLKDLDKKSD